MPFFPHIHQIGYDPTHYRYFFQAHKPGNEPSVTYRPLNTKQTSRLVVWEPLLRWALDKTQDLHGEIRKVLGINADGLATDYPDQDSLVQFIEYQEAEISTLKEQLGQLRNENHELNAQLGGAALVK